MVESWDEAIEEAKLNYTDWDEIVEEARNILRKYAKNTHQSYINSSRWKRIRQQILERDNYNCQDCLKLFPKILSKYITLRSGIIFLEKLAEEVHHIDYGYVFTDEEKDFCVSLCNICHKLRHSVSSGSYYELLKEKRDNNLNKIIFRKIYKSQWFIQAINKEHQDYLNSITLKPNKFLDDGDK